MRILENLQPKRVFHYFEELCAIPHGSGNTKAISDYCVKFANERGLKVYQDGLNNVIIKKHASAGYEDKPAVILQGHLDMVCEKTEDCDIDFEKDGLRLAVDGDWVFAKDTSLGGDDGIAIAMALAVLEDEALCHPALEAVFTVDEETGMFGAEGIDVSLLEGNTLINIDSEEMGVFIVSCAGGGRAKASLKLDREKIDMPCYTVTVDGLLGGHSGTEIDKGHLNAIKVMGDFLRDLMDISQIRVGDIHGGSKDNVIPSRCRCTVFTNEDIAKFAGEFVNKYPKENDGGLNITVTPCDQGMGLTLEKTNLLISLLSMLPSGVVKMSDDIEGLVQTSLNMGVISTGNENLDITFSVRSSLNSEKQDLLGSLAAISRKNGADFSHDSDYPAWEYRKNSPLRDTMVKVYSDLFGKAPLVLALHAGLECGLFAKKIPDLDAVSFGPDILDIHSVKEKMSVSSVADCYKFLRQVLETI